MKLTEQKQGAVTVMKPAGPLTHAESVALKERVTREVGATLGRVVVDMSEVPFVDSAALEAMLDITEHMGQSGQTLKLCSPNKTVREVLAVTDLAGSFDIFEDVTTAVRSFL
jgi:anti-anti-sigma factor